MPNGQEQDQQSKPQRDYVKVFGPDNRYYRFPKGTTKDQAVSYFKTKGITSPESPAPKPAAGTPPRPSPGTPPAPTPGAPPPIPKDVNLEKLQKTSDWQVLEKYLSWRPRWDNPQQILQDPEWWRRSMRYAGGELIGASKAGVTVVMGGAKMLHDVASALDPFESYERGDYSAQEQVARDIKGVGRGMLDVGKASWDLIRHFPEASADPEAFGNTVTNAAMIVDGGIKGSKAVAELLKKSPEQAARISARANSGVPSRFFRRKAFEDAYVHTKGLDVAKKLNDASKAVHEEVKLHAEGISSQIDKAIPTGVVDASAEAATISKEFADVVKTPEGKHPILQQMVADARKTAPGQWSWEKVRQFRSNVGRSTNKTVGPQKIVLTKIYQDLTNKLGGTATQYGLGESWKHYNELESKVSKEFGDLLDDVHDAQSGKEVAQKLGKDPALTQEMSKNLSKYGLDHAEVAKFIKDSKRIMDSQGKWRGSLFRMAYGTPAGVPIMLAARAAGAPWLESVAAGATVGYAFTHIINLARAMKLSPDVIMHILSERELPGKMPVATGTFPEGGPPQLPSGAPPTPTPRTGEGAAAARMIKEPPKQAPEASRAALIEDTQKAAAEGTPEEKAVAKQRLREMGVPEKTEKFVERAPAEAVGREPGAKPGTTRESPIGRATKARERVSKAREEAGRTHQAEIADAQARAQAKDIDVSKLQIPEMEEALRTMNPEAYSGLQKLRKVKAITDPEYQEALKYYILEAYESRGGL